MGNPPVRRASETMENIFCHRSAPQAETLETFLAQAESLGKAEASDAEATPGAFNEALNEFKTEA